MERVLCHPGIEAMVRKDPRLRDLAYLLAPLCAGESDTVLLRDVYKLCGYNSVKSASKALNEYAPDYDFIIENGEHLLTLSGVEVICYEASVRVKGSVKPQFVKRFKAAYDDFRPPGNPSCSGNRD